MRRAWGCVPRGCVPTSCALKASPSRRDRVPKNAYRLTDRQRPPKHVAMFHLAIILYGLRILAAGPILQKKRLVRKAQETNLGYWRTIAASTQDKGTSCTNWCSPAVNPRRSSNRSATLSCLKPTGAPSGQKLDASWVSSPSSIPWRRENVCSGEGSADQKDRVGGWVLWSGMRSLHSVPSNRLSQSSTVITSSCYLGVRMS